MDNLVGIVMFTIALGIASVLMYKAIQVASKKRIESLEKEASDLLEKAKRDAETTKKEAILEAKEEVHRLRNDLEKDSRERRNEIQRLERRVIQREESLDKKSDLLERKEETINKRLQEIDDMEANVQNLYSKRREELERIATLSKDEAREILLEEVRREITHETAMMIKDIEARAKEEADKKAREMG